MNRGNFSVCESQVSEQEGTDLLYGFLKTAMDSTQLENNQEQKGLNPDPYADPATRKEREDTDNALWGQESAGTGNSGTEQVHSNAVWDGFRNGRERFLKCNFDAFEPSQAQSQELLGNNLEHFKSGDHESHTAFNRDHSDRKPEIPETVLEKTKRLLDA
jgi:hypothetical protein